MSVGIGIVGEDYVILGADVQSVYSLGPEMIRPGQGKSFVLSDCVALCGAGGYSHLSYLGDEIQERLPKEEMSPKEFRHLIEDATLTLHERYNLSQPPMIKDDKDLRYEVTAIICSRHPGGHLALHVSSPGGDVDVVTEHFSNGSGAHISEYLLQKLYHNGMDINEALRVASYVISEAVAIDPWCGGLWLGYLSGDESFVEIEQKEMLGISKIVQERRGLLHDQVYEKLFDDEFNFKG